MRRQIQMLASARRTGARKQLAVLVSITYGISGSAASSLKTSKRPGYLPMQKVEKMFWRMSSTVVAPVTASIGRSAE